MTLASALLHDDLSGREPSREVQDKAGPQSRNLSELEWGRR